MNNSDILLIERYKYILSRKQSLNDATFKIATLYQTMIFAISVAQYKVLADLHSKSISQALAAISSYALAGFFLAVTLLALLLIIGGIGSWFDYREEENNYLLLTGKPDNPPKLQNILRWYESYIFIIIFTTGIIGSIIYCNHIIPQINPS